MAPKRNEPSSSEEEESSSESTAATKEQEGSEEEEQGEPSESEPEKPQLRSKDQPNRQPLSQPKQTPPPSNQVLSSQSESMSDTESEPNMPLKSNPETQNSKNPKPQPPSPLKPTSLKRPSRSDNSKQPNNKRKKTSPEGRSEDMVGATSEKKPLFQRLWSDEDEIALLKGMVGFMENKGVDPSHHMSEFYEFVKKDIKMDASQSQLINKIRGLKKRFKNNNEGKGKNSRAFKLMMKLWSAGKGTIHEERLKMNETTENNKSKSVLLKESSREDKNVVQNGSNSSWKKVGLFMDESICVTEMSRFFPRSVDKVFLKGLELIGEKKRAELEDRWLKLRLAEMKIEGERAVLFHEQRRLILDALDQETS